MKYVQMHTEDKVWFREGTDILHREDGPAVIRFNGDETWYKDGYRHREDGPALTRRNGEQTWYQHGLRHRVGGPASIQPDIGMEVWWHLGKKHRIDGPAVIWVGGTHRWYIDNVEISSAPLYQQLAGLSDEDMTMLLLKFNGF